jgi:transcriptional regulator with XRE-family HTH domain
MPSITSEVMVTRAPVGYRRAVSAPPVGELLRGWRDRRGLSQLELSLRAEISTRHLSFVETGRSRPSRDMLLHLADELDVPLRERNHLLLAAGYAPVYRALGLEDMAMSPVREALRRLLAGHEPYPAVVVDRSAGLLTEGSAPELLAPPANAMRLALHPDGLAGRIVNLGEWRAHLLGRLRRQVALTADEELARLLDEVRAYPCDQLEPEVELPGPGDVAVPLRIRRGGRELAFLSTVATFGTPLDVTVAELAIESFFPADDATAAALRG